MKFKVDKSSKTGQQIVDLMNKISDYTSQAIELRDQLGAHEHRGASMAIGGGIDSLVFKEPQDPKVWKKVYVGHEYMPKNNIKIGKDLNKKISELPIVSAWQLNDILNLKLRNPFNHPGWHFHDDDDFIILTYADEWPYPKNEDLIEITTKEYKLLTKNQ